MSKAVKKAGKAGTGPLAGIRVVEIAGIGPAPFACMLLADLGADVVIVDRPRKPGAKNPLDLGKNNITNRGKRSICLDLKKQESIETVLKLVEKSDVLVEGMRPGVMEKLGLGPDVLMARNPRLIFGRMTGWGQDGPLAHSAGHDLNYIALSGALWFSGTPGTPPLAPPTLVGDLGGGALYLVMGILAALLHVKAGGKGQVIDAAIVDGSANLMNLLLSLHAAQSMPMNRGQGLLDGPYWYGTYPCSDGQYISLGSLEPQFHAELIDKLGLKDDPAFARHLDPTTWATARQKLAALFASKPQAVWCEILGEGDACFAPVLDPRAAATHPHIAARDIYHVSEGVLQAAPAPRFSGFPDIGCAPIPLAGEHSEQILAELGEIGEISKLAHATLTDKVPSPI